MRALPSYWDNLIKLLGPNNVLNFDFSLSKDFGLHLKRLGFDEFASLIFPDVPIAYIGKISDDQYTFGSGLTINDGDNYVVTFDFNAEVLEQLHGKISDRAFQILREPLADAINQVMFADAIYHIVVDCRVGDKLAENEDEIFLPLWVNRIVE